MYQANYYLTTVYLNTFVYLADPGKARGCSTNTFIIDLLINLLSHWSFVKISLQRPHALMVEDGAFSHKIDYSFFFFYFSPKHFLSTKSLDNRQHKEILSQFTWDPEHSQFQAGPVKKNTLYATIVQEILNLKGHPNCITGSGVTEILLKGRIFTIGAASSVEGLRSTGLPRLVFYQITTITKITAITTITKQSIDVLCTLLPCNRITQELYIFF